jgi:hypothetical protein
MGVRLRGSHIGGFRYILELERRRGVGEGVQHPNSDFDRLDSAPSVQGCNKTGS